MSIVTNSSISERDVRQRSLVPPERLAACQALVVGVGAVGRQLAWQLAAMGVPRLTLIDHDVVSIENLAPQGYAPEDLGQPKVHATQRLCERVNPDSQIVTLAERFKRSAVRELPTDLACAVFLCVDSIVTRRWIWEAIHRHVDFVADGRMHGEVIRVLASDMPASDSHYPRTLFGAEEAFASACTSRSTIYAASITAGLMVSPFARWLRRRPVDQDILLNLLAAELVAQGDCAKPAA